MVHENHLALARQSKGILIAAHRGVSAGNIPCNTLPAFEAALYQGADILETDLTHSADGTLLVFHPKKEKAHLNQDVHLEQMSMEQIRQLRFVNIDKDPTQWGILTLDEFLEHFKHRCIINLDHGWDEDAQMVNMIRAVRRHAMLDQVLIKTPCKPRYLQLVQEQAPDVMYMPIIKEEDTVTGLLEGMNIHYAGAELVFAREDSPLIAPEYIQSHHDKGRMLWVNPLIYYYKSQLSGGHSDDVAAVGDPECGWGWLMDKGFDILQTDWVQSLRLFMNRRG